MVKKCFSSARASAHVIPLFKSFDPGCLTVNHPFASGSASFRIKRSQFSSSPDGIRSGLVRTPIEGVKTFHFPGDDGIDHTDCPLALWVILLRNVVRSLIFKIGCNEVSLGEGKKIARLTLASDGEEDQATGFTNICSDQILDKVNVRGISALADASNKTFSNTFSTVTKQKRGTDAHQVNHRTINQSAPVR